MKPEIVFLEDCNLLLADQTGTVAVPLRDVTFAFNVIARNDYKYIRTKNFIAINAHIPYNTCKLN